MDAGTRNASLLELWEQAAMRFAHPRPQITDERLLEVTREELAKARAKLEQVEHDVKVWTAAVMHLEQRIAGR